MSRFIGLFYRVQGWPLAWPGQPSVDPPISCLVSFIGTDKIYRLLSTCNKPALAFAAKADIKAGKAAVEGSRLEIGWQKWPAKAAVH